MPLGFFRLKRNLHIYPFRSNGEERFEDLANTEVGRNSKPICFRKKEKIKIKDISKKQDMIA